MNAQWKLAAFAILAIAAANAADVNINPSQATPGQNPSQTTPAQNPSQAVPGPNPSGALPVNPPITPPEAEIDVAVPPAAMVPAPNQPRAVPTERQLIAQVRKAITRGPNAALGLPNFGVGGIPVTALAITRQNGWFTLEGVVGSERDKAEAGARAAAIVGEQNVLNELTVR